MDAVLWMGTLVGAVLGCAHAVYVYRTVAREGLAAAEGGAFEAPLTSMVNLGAIRALRFEKCLGDRRQQGARDRVS